MINVISITKRIEEKNKETKIAKEKFLTLSDRLKEYTDFLVRQARKAIMKCGIKIYTSS